MLLLLLLHRRAIGIFRLGKEARKKELKKNKKQRLIVRQSVLKGKNPRSLVSELEHLDRMEFDPVNASPYNIKVLQEKRKKAKETWDQVYRLYVRVTCRRESERWIHSRRKNNPNWLLRWTLCWSSMKNHEHKPSLGSVRSMNVNGTDHHCVSFRVGQRNSTCHTWWDSDARIT